MSNITGLILFAIIIAAIVGVANLIHNLEHKNYED